MFAVPSFFGYNTTFVSTPVATAATGVGSTSFTANWNAFSGASYYLLDVSLSSSFSTFVLQNTVTTATSYVVTGLTASTTYYYRIRAAVNVDSDVAGFVSRVYTAGGTLSYTEVTATETLVADLKSYGIWTAMKAIYPMVGASAAACVQNLVSSSFTGTFTSGWTFASTGVTPNGTSAYMDTTIAPSSNLTSGNTHASVYIRTNTSAGAKQELGSIDTPSVGGEYSIITKFTGNLAYPIIASFSNTFFPTYSNTNSQGFWVVNRENTTNIQYYNRSTKVVDSTQTNGMSIRNIYVGARNNDGSADRFSDRENAFVSIGDGLTNTQASNFYTAVQTFNQTLNRQVGAQIVSDADAQAYIDRVYTAGGTLTNTEANAVNQLTIDMKAAGIWTAMKAVYPMVGSSAAACAQNLKSSSFTGSFSSGWTFASTGIQGNGTSAYFDTLFNPNSQSTQNSSHVSVYLRTNSGGGSQGVFTCASDFSSISDNFGIGKYGGGADVRGYIGSGLGNGASFTSNNLGLWTVSTNGSSTQTLYEDGTSRATAAYTQSLPNYNVYLGAGNYGTGGVQLYSSFNFAFASIGDGLTDTQASNFYTCVQTFQTTLSRQV